MIICVCGMIGSGKSTYCEMQNGIVSDFDNIHDKKKQLDFTLELNAKGETVYHITCYPTAMELDVFEGLNVEYVWINTTLNQCKENILRRARKRDIQNLSETLRNNMRLRSLYRQSRIPFKVVDVFEGTERW